MGDRIRSAITFFLEKLRLFVDFSKSINVLFIVLTGTRHRKTYIYEPKKRILDRITRSTGGILTPTSGGTGINTYFAYKN